MNDGDGSGPRVNPIVAMAERIRSRRDLEAALDSGTPPVSEAAEGDARAAFDAFGAALAVGAKRLNGILGAGRMTYVRLERPPRVRLRFNGLRLAFDLDETRQLVAVAGCELDGTYQFDASNAAQGLVNLSQLSTDPGYGRPLAAAAFLKAIARDAELARPAHLDDLGPLRL